MGQNQLQQLIISAIFANARRRMAKVQDEETKLNVLLDTAKELDENRPTRELDDTEADEVMALLSQVMCESETVEDVLNALEKTVAQISEISATPA
jgi:LPS O-antigen subunit length determinant protein (WzzB/FepE family)